MYTDLSIYYLNQLGITPWVTKETALSLASKADMERLKLHKLIVIKPHKTTSQACLLIEKFCSFVNLRPSEIHLIDEEQFDINTLILELNMPILVLGSEQYSQGVNTANVFYTLDPDYVLANPSSKRQVLEHLQSLNQKLMTSD